MYCVKRELAIWLKHFVYWGESNLGVIENSSLGVRKKMYQIKKTPPLPSVILLMKDP